MRRSSFARPFPALSSLAGLSLLVAPASAQMFGAEATGGQQIFDMAGDRGQGSGTWIEPGTQGGAAFGELYDTQGTTRYLLEANVLGNGGGDQEELFPFGILTGELHAYKLYIVPTEPEVVATVSGQWLNVGPDGGIFEAVLYGTDPQTGSPVGIGAINGTFEFPVAYGGYYPYYNPISYEAGSSPGAGAGQELSREGLANAGEAIGWQPPFLVDMSTPAGGMGTGQQATAEGLGNFGDAQGWEPPLIAFPPYPADSLGDAGEAMPLGGGQSVGQAPVEAMMQELSEGQAQSQGSQGDEGDAQGRQGVFSFRWIVTD